MSKLTVTWFRHSHENRNDLLRYGLMQAAGKAQIKYLERDISHARSGGYSEAVIQEPHRHLSFLTVKGPKGNSKVIVDSEDSFIQLSSTIREADIYFIAGYNSDLFLAKKIPDGYDWQNNDDVQWYRERTRQLIEDFGDQFYKIVPFIPIGPDLSFTQHRSWWCIKIDNALYRFYRYFTGRNYWAANLKMFDDRYRELLSFRSSELKYDVVLKDTLWGWPKHRFRLHAQLGRLADRFRIHSELNWHPPTLEDGSDKLPLAVAVYPVKSGSQIVNYEKMLAESKLAVFACGFHWGWRNIMTFALMTGIPVLTDRPLLEPYFDLAKFRIFYNDSGDWHTLGDILERTDAEHWQEIRSYNQKVYDTYLSPLAVATYFLSRIT